MTRLLILAGMLLATAAYGQEAPPSFSGPGLFSGPSLFAPAPVPRGPTVLVPFGQQQSQSFAYFNGPNGGGVVLDLGDLWIVQPHQGPPLTILIPGGRPAPLAPVLPFVVPPPAGR